MDWITHDIIEQVVRTLLLAVTPTLIIPLASLLVAFLLGMMAVRDDAMQYAVRIVALVGVVALFGVSVSSSLIELMRLVLR